MFSPPHIWRKVVSRAIARQRIVRQTEWLREWKSVQQGWNSAAAKNPNEVKYKCLDGVSAVSQTWQCRQRNMNDDGVDANTILILQLFVLPLTEFVLLFRFLYVCVRAIHIRDSPRSGTRMSANGSVIFFIGDWLHGSYFSPGMAIQSGSVPLFILRLETLFAFSSIHRSFFQSMKYSHSLIFYAKMREQVCNACFHIRNRSISQQIDFSFGYDNPRGTSVSISYIFHCYYPGEQ